MQLGHEDSTGEGLTVQVLCSRTLIRTPGGYCGPVYVCGNV